MKIAITGAAGFIGMHLCEYLVQEGHEIICAIDSLKPIYGTNMAEVRANRLEKFGLHISQIDIAKVPTYEVIEKFSGAEVVIHLAAYAGVRQSALMPHEYSASNLTGFANVLEAVRCIKPSLFLFASSSSVYGNTSVTQPQEERTATGLNLASYYAATKWTNEILARSHAKNYEINTVGMRFFTVYGPHGRPDMAYMKFLEKIQKKEVIELYGIDGGKRSYSYITDVIRIIESLIKSPTLLTKLKNSPNHFEALNIGNTESYAALELIGYLEQESKQKATISIVDRPLFDVNATQASMNKTNFYIGEQKEFTNLKVGTAKFTRWYLDEFLMPH